MDRRACELESVSNLCESAGGGCAHWRAVSSHSVLTVREHVACERRRVCATIEDRFLRQVLSSLTQQRRKNPGDQDAYRFSASEAVRGIGPTDDEFLEPAAGHHAQSKVWVQPISNA